MLKVGVACIDITPPPGLLMAGFGGRTRPATGAHDPLTVRAIAVGDTALVVVDAIGLDAASCNRIASNCGLENDRVVVAATHTHGGPHTMPGRLGGHVDPIYLEQLESSAARAIDMALYDQQRCQLAVAVGRLDDVARNRRHKDGPADASVPILKITSTDGKVIAVMVSFACHPVVLDASNLQWTADYPHMVRKAIEAEFPGSTALFVTGCAGDVNTGHLAHQSNSLSRGAARTYAEAQRIGNAVAATAIDATFHIVPGHQTGAAQSECVLEIVGSHGDRLGELTQEWRAARADADPAAAAIYDIWLNWANGPARKMPQPFPTRVGVLRWGELMIVHMPGEIFAATGLEVRAALPHAAFVLSYCGDNPGYLPPRAEFDFGGYEVTEAHRFYGLPGGFAPGSAEHLRDAAIACGQTVQGAIA